MLNRSLRTTKMALLGTLLLLSPFLLAEPLSAQEQKTDLAQYYGFDKLEIFKLEQRSGNLLSADLNHDGLNDLILIDNSHSRLDFLQQRRKKPTTVDQPVGKFDPNLLENDWRFEHRKIPVNKQVASLMLGDFNHDNRTDIAYFGVPDRLVIRLQPETGDWTERISFRLPDVSAVRWNIAGGDLNGDGRDDIVVLGKNETYLLYQDKNGKLSPPLTIMNTSQKLGLAQVADLDADGRNDLSYLATDDQDRAFCARLQTADGRLGPELRFELNQPRAVSLANIDDNPGKEILVIDSRTGRAKVLKLQQPVSKPGEVAGRLIQYGFGSRGSGRHRDLATGDLDGDGLTDVVVTDPEAAQMIVFRQKKNQGLDLGTTYPGLVAASQIRIADVDGNKSAEVIVLSSREKTIGISRLENGRLTFPVSLPVTDEPVALELADLNAEGNDEILYIARKKEGRSSKYFLRALKLAGEGKWENFSFGESAEVSLELRGAPERMLRLDANNDGRPDFLIFLGLDRPPHLLTFNDDGIPSEVKTAGGIGLGEVNAGAVFVGNRKQPIVLVAQKNFARHLLLDKKQQWRVQDQYNASESNARIVGAAVLNLDGQPGDEIVLIDSGIRKLRVLRREGSIYRPWKEVEIGSFPYQSTQVADLNGDGQDDLLLFGRGKFAVLYTGRTDPVLKEVASFETKLKNTYFSDVVAGDLNDDGQADLAVIDTRTHFIEILDYDRRRGLRHGTHFKVFEEKSFSRRGNVGSQPREAVISDVTNDGLPDLILLSHDRVLVYPQDRGR